MLYYEFCAEGKLNIDKKTLKPEGKAAKDQPDPVLELINEKLAKDNAVTRRNTLVAYECKGKKGKKSYTVKAAAALSQYGEALKENLEKLAKAVGSLFLDPQVKVEAKEIPSGFLQMLLFNKDLNPSVKAAVKAFRLPDNRRCEFNLRQDMNELSGDITLRAAQRKAKGLMADQRFLEELERIFSQENRQSFVAHPVHYRIVAEDKEQGEKLRELLMKALLQKKRLISARSDCYYKLDGYNPWPIVDKFMNMTAGCTAVIYADKSENGESQEGLKLLKNMAERYSRDTLFIIMEVGEGDNNGQLYYEGLSEFLDIVTVGTTPMSVEGVLGQLKAMAVQKGMEELFEACPPRLKITNKVYSHKEVQRIFQKWSKGCVQKMVYKAYADLELDKPQGLEGQTDYEAKLQEMIGLKNVKELVKELIAVGQMDKLRRDKGLKQQPKALHMLFTGNPGSAKTTVARLLPKILAKKGIIATPKLVEVGRADLVGQFVGWTAKLVKEKFAEAKGGILFIDEAYALCGEGKDFGPEAINTLVQEMENNRDQVLVIFAGYSNKMKKFLEQNEGLKSRIPYHLDFPDYNPEELMEILELMAKEQGFTINAEAKLKCQGFFKTVVTQEDFGNGRFVRNLLEQAATKQALRLTGGNQLEELPAEILGELKAEDFEINKLLPSGDNKPKKLGLLA